MSLVPAQDKCTKIGEAYNFPIHLQVIGGDMY